MSRSYHPHHALIFENESCNIIEKPYMIGNGDVKDGQVGVELGWLWGRSMASIQSKEKDVDEKRVTVVGKSFGRFVRSILNSSGNVSKNIKHFPGSGDAVFTYDAKKSSINIKNDETEFEFTVDKNLLHAFYG